jgi:hypothetical protein
MKPFLSLINYSQDSKRRWNKDRLYALKYWLLFIFFFVAWMVTTDTIDELPITEFLMYAFGLMTAIVSVLYCAKPSTLYLVPISYKKRVLYYYASILVYTIIAIVTVFVLLMLVVIPIQIANYIEDGSNFIAFIFEGTYKYGADVYLFSAFKALFTISLISIASQMTKKRDIIISFAVLYVLHFVGAIILATLVQTKTYSINMSINIYPYFNTLPNPALAVILCIVFGVLAFVCSFLLTVYNQKPKNY